MAELSCLYLPKPNNDDELRRQAMSMKKLRLFALQSDPQCWISKYEDEVREPLEFSMDRVHDPAAEHWVAIKKQLATDDNRMLLDIKYEAALVMIKLGNVTSNDFAEYLMAAVAVRPEHRGRGICSQLILKGIKWANDDWRKTQEPKAVIHTTVVEGNVSAQRLYAKLGFRITAHLTEKNKADMDVPVVNMDFRLDEQT